MIYRLGRSCITTEKSYNNNTPTDKNPGRFYATIRFLFIIIFSNFPRLLLFFSFLKNCCSSEPKLSVPCNMLDQSLNLSCQSSPIPSIKLKKKKRKEKNKTNKTKQAGICVLNHLLQCMCVCEYVCFLRTTIFNFLIFGSIRFSFVCLFLLFFLIISLCSPLPPSSDDVVVVRVYVFYLNENQREIFF